MYFIGSTENVVQHILVHDIVHKHIIYIYIYIYVYMSSCFCYYVLYVSHVPCMLGVETWRRSLWSGNLWKSMGRKPTIYYRLYTTLDAFLNIINTTIYCLRNPKPQQLPATIVSIAPTHCKYKQLVTVELQTM